MSSWHRKKRSESALEFSSIIGGPAILSQRWLFQRWKTPTSCLLDSMEIFGRPNLFSETWKNYMLYFYDLCLIYHVSIPDICPDTCIQHFTDIWYKCCVPLRQVYSTTTWIWNEMRMSQGKRKILKRNKVIDFCLILWRFFFWRFCKGFTLPGTNLKISRSAKGNDLFSQHLSFKGHVSFQEGRP